MQIADPPEAGYVAVALRECQDFALAPLTETRVQVTTPVGLLPAQALSRSNVPDLVDQILPSVPLPVAM